MTPTQQELWARICAFQFNPVGATSTFEMRLAKEQGWTPEFTHRVVEEYRRFLFLCASAPHPCTPSEIVDEAWHLHLVYSRSYWEEMCGQILGKPIHHEPGFGLPGQSEGHRDAFVDTMQSYEEAFGESAPADIWRAKKTVRPVVVPRRHNLTWVYATAAIFALGLIVAGWSNIGWLHHRDRRCIDGGERSNLGSGRIRNVHSATTSNAAEPSFGSSVSRSNALWV